MRSSWQRTPGARTCSVSFVTWWTSPPSQAGLSERELELAAASWRRRVLPRLRGIYRRTWYANNLMLGRLRHAVEAVEASGADPIVISSCELPALYYEEYGLRRVDVLRVLVTVERADAAARALLNDGWEEPLAGTRSLGSDHCAQFQKGADQCFLY
jgi:hypothetical protein